MHSENWFPDETKIILPKLAVSVSVIFCIKFQMLGICDRSIKKPKNKINSVNYEVFMSSIKNLQNNGFEFSGSVGN